MLNEIYDIYKGLNAVGELPKIKHNDIKTPGRNNTTFRVILNKEGNVESVTLMTKEQIDNTWSLGNKQTQFPAIKIKYPLIDGAYEAYANWKTTNRSPKGEDYRKLINIQARRSTTLSESIKEWPHYRKAILSRKKQLESCHCHEVYELFERYSKSKNGTEILEQIKDKLLEYSANESDTKTLKAICDLLFGEKLKNNGKEVEDSSRITLLLDCFPNPDIDIYASSKEYESSLSDALLAIEGKSSSESLTGQCAISGEKGKLVDQTFPEEKLAVIGPTILFSKNDGTSGETVERYGKSKGQSFSLSEDLSRKLAWSISLLTSDKYKDITWSKLPSSSLLLAYCKENHNLPVTPLINGNYEVEDFDDYLDATNSVIESFKGAGLSLDATVDFVEIIKVDKANRKINFSTSTRIDNLIESSKQWHKACGNTPDFQLSAKINKDTILASPWAISPKQVIFLTQHKYIREGDESIKLIGMSFADVMRLFLDRFQKNSLIHNLINISDQYQPLFRFCASGKLQWSLGKKARTRSDPRLNAKALSATTLISLLLFKLGRTKENYMNDFAFQLGQMCSAMDELHIGYCKSERNGDIPTTLLGNQVYGMALQSPQKALEYMASRRRPYDSWVKRVSFKKEKSDDKEITNAIFAQRWMSKHAEILSHFLADNKGIISDTYKAELMLGYLAGRPFEKAPESNKQTSTEGDEQ